MVREVTVASEGTTGLAFNTPAVVIPVIIPTEDVDAMLASYDSDNAYSPSATDSRAIARVVLDALKEKVG